jgi:ribosomal protein S18 acetylase RimI-like enzyme
VTTALSIREVREEDFPALWDIERSAGGPFAEIGMTFVAEDQPPSVELLREFAEDGRCWVTVKEDDRPVAYLLADKVDGLGYLDQVSVHQDYARRRIGVALLDHMIAWVKDQGLSAITLTTYVEVPWNGPYYEHNGFRYLSEDEESPGLKNIRAAEKAHGLDQWPRACMRRDL